MKAHEAVEDLNDLGRRDVLGEEGSVARIGATVAADEDCRVRASAAYSGKVSHEGEDSLFHPLSVAINPKSFDCASAHSRTHPDTPPLNLCGLLTPR